MSTPHILQTIMEIIMVALLISGLFFEDKLIAFEQKLISRRESKNYGVFKR